MGPFFHAGILPCLQVGPDGQRALPAPLLSRFAADPPGPPAGGTFGTLPLPPAIGPRPVRWAARTLSLARWEGHEVMGLKEGLAALRATAANLA